MRGYRTFILVKKNAVMEDMNYNRKEIIPQLDNYFCLYCGGDISRFSKYNLKKKC